MLLFHSLTHQSTPRWALELQIGQTPKGIGPRDCFPEWESSINPWLLLQPGRLTSIASGFRELLDWPSRTDRHPVTALLRVALLVREQSKRVSNSQLMQRCHLLELMLSSSSLCLQKIYIAKAVIRLDASTAGL